MIGVLEEVLKRKEVRQLLRLEEQRLGQSVTLVQSSASLLRAVWLRFNDATARQAKHCKIDTHLFG